MKTMQAEAVKIKLRAIKNIGYSLSGLYLSMVQFTLDRAFYPVKIALRDGEPIHFAAQQIINNNDVFRVSIENIKKLKEWQSIWINRELLNFSRHIPVKRYFQENGIGEELSYVDTGYAGSLAKIMRAMDKQVQTIFMFVDKSEIEVPYRVLIDDHFNRIIEPYCDRNEERYIKNRPEGSMCAICEDIFEAIPKKYDRPFEFIERNGKTIPNLLEREYYIVDQYESFYEGLRDGILDCKNFDVGLSKGYLNNIFYTYNTLRQGLATEKYSLSQIVIDEIEELTVDMKQIYKGIN